MTDGQIIALALIVMMVERRAPGATVQALQAVSISQPKPATNPGMFVADAWRRVFALTPEGLAARLRCPSWLKRSIAIAANGKRNPFKDALDKTQGLSVESRALLDKEFEEAFKFFRSGKGSVLVVAGEDSGDDEACGFACCGHVGGFCHVGFRYVCKYMAKVADSVEGAS